MKAKPYLRSPQECEILINLTHSCNLRCTYCFVADGLAGNGGKVFPARMDRRTQEQTLAFIQSYAAPFHSLTLHFYGGEPFTYFEGLQYFTERAKSLFHNSGKQLKFSVTTNGTLITREIADYLNAQRFSVLVSLDGPPQVHDQMRIDNSGAPTFHRVLKAVQLLKSCEGVSLGLSAVIHRKNRLLEAYQFLNSLSPAFIKTEYVRVHPDSPHSLMEEERQQYFQDLAVIAEDVAEQLLAGKVPQDYRFNSRILQIWRQVRRREFCGAGSAILGIASSGDIFPCTLLVSESDCRLGEVQTGLSPVAVKRFKAWHRGTGKLTCRRCPVKDWCGGGCAAMWKIVGQGFCEYIHEEIDRAFSIYEQVVKTRPEALALLVSQEFYQRLTNLGSVSDLAS